MGYCPIIAENVIRKKPQIQINGSEEDMQTRIREYRARLSMTQEELAKAVGVRRETIVFLEQGKYNPSLRLAHDVAMTLHSRIDDLFIFEDDLAESHPREIIVD